MPSRPSRAVTDPPAGLVYEPALLSTEAEHDALAAIDSLRFDAIRMHGVVAKRTARHFGFDYDYERRGLIQEAEPLPDWILPVRERAATLGGLDPETLVETLIQRYPAGAQIGWHRDAPMFGTVVGVSLLSSSRMRFRRDVDDEREVYELELAPRSGYVLAGEARTKWQHHVPPTKELRYSITFRTLRNPDRWTKTPPPR
jgi:alkylated DNA repair protein (DNA oxidative demethylase)